MTSSTTPQDRAVEALVAKFNPHYAEYRMAPASPRDVDAMTTFTAGDGNLSIRTLDFGEIVDCLADAGLLSSGTQEEDQDGSLRSEPSADGEAAVYVLLSGRQVSHTVEHYNGAVMVDMDDYDEPVGVEILDAREVTVNGHRVQATKAIPEGDTEELHLIRQVLHDNNCGCQERPGKHDEVAREILSTLAAKEKP